MEEEKIVNEASVESSNEESQVQESPSDEKKKIKNLISLSILLAGLLIGSLFVDLGQLIKGGGISQKVLDGKDVFSLNDKTWVAFEDPIVNVQVITDESCEACKADDFLLQLRSALPTISTSSVAYDSTEGKDLIEKFKIKTLPAFVFDANIKDTGLFSQAEPIFKKEGEMYSIDTAQVGIPAGKYLELPTIGENDIVIGSKDSKVTLIEFSDFQCPYCQKFQQSVDEILKEYGDKITFVYKQFPLTSIHPKAMDAAMASECANEQGKFLEYADKLFTNQADWSKDTNNARFGTYAAQLGLNVGQFNQCVSSAKYQEKIQANATEAQEFGISGTPALFINDQFQPGASSVDALKKVIDEQLAK
ncbi:MAG: DsbA family protein [Candidatus Moranbacteria bacterium]|jgi:protein-disulfide isomerase|nr:DsbA family protein [Candidatus Moranbacteria bacterium]